IDDVRAACPAAEIVVFDNNSTDRSAAIAAEKSVRVVRVSRQGKGNVVRAMLKRVEADVYVMLDADATYPAARIPDLLRPVVDGSSDMVVGARLGSPEAGAFRRFHHTGNLILCRLISLIWGARLTDVLSGYRAFTAETLILLGAVLISTGLILHTLNFRVKELHSVITRRPGP